jgi:hypothetical protein
MQAVSARHADLRAAQAWWPADGPRDVVRIGTLIGRTALSASL